MSGCDPRWAGKYQSLLLWTRASQPPPCSCLQPGLTGHPGIVSASRSPLTTTVLTTVMWKPTQRSSWGARFSCGLLCNERVWVTKDHQLRVTMAAAKNQQTTASRCMAMQTPPSKTHVSEQTN